MSRGHPKGVLLDSSLLRQRRASLGWTQRELSIASEISYRTVQAAEGGSPVSTATAIGLCVTLGLPYVEALIRPPQQIRDALLLRGYTPLEPPDRFIGRSDELERLRQALATGSEVTIIGGPSGIGKSALVRQLLRDIQGEYPAGVVWIRGQALGERRLFRRVQRDLADALGFGDRLPLPELVPPESYDAAFAARLWSKPRLIVLDDLKDASVVQRFRQGVPPVRLLVTTQHRSVSEALDAYQIVLPPWTSSETRAFLLTKAGRDIEPADLDALIAIVDGMPGAAVQLLNRWETDPTASPTDLVRSLGTKPNLDGQLSPSAEHLVKRLHLLGSEPFSIQWALALSQRPESETRDLLRELSDRYMLAILQSDEGIERFQLDPRTLRIVDTNPSDDQGFEQLLWSQSSELADMDPKDVFSIVTADSQVWQHLIARLADPISLPDGAALNDPSTVPPRDGDRLLGSVLWNLRGAFQFGTNPSLPHWLLSAASTTREPLLQAQISGLLGWQLVHTMRRASAARWLHRSASWFLEADVDATHRHIRCEVVASHLERTRSTHQDVHQRRERLLVPEGSGRCVALSARVTGVLPTDPAAAIELAEEALRHLGELTEKGQPQQQAVLQLCRAVAQRELGLPVDNQQVRRAALVMGRVAEPDHLYAWRINALAEALTDRLAWRPKTGAETLMGTAPSHVQYRLAHLYDIAIALQGGYAKTGAVFDSRLGPMQFELVVYRPPYSEEVGVAIELPLPIRPMLELFDAHGLEHALRFVSVAGGTEHPAWRALTSLAERGPRV